MTRELGWSKLKAGELSDVANELEKCVATDRRQIHLKILREEWTVGVIQGESSTFYSLLKNMGVGSSLSLFLSIVIHLSFFSVKHFSFTSSSLITVSLFFHSESMINMPGNAWWRLLAADLHLFWLQKLLLIVTFLYASFLMNTKCFENYEIN